MLIKLSIKIGDYLRDDGDEDWEEVFLASCSDQVDGLLEILRILEGPELLVNDENMLVSAEAFCRNCDSSYSVISDNTGITTVGSAMGVRHAWAGEGDIHYSDYEVEYVKIIDEAEWLEKKLKETLSACALKNRLKAIRYEGITL